MVSPINTRYFSVTFEGFLFLKYEKYVEEEWLKSLWDSRAAYESILYQYKSGLFSLAWIFISLISLLFCNPRNLQNLRPVSVAFLFAFCFSVACSLSCASAILDSIRKFARVWFYHMYVNINFSCCDSAFFAAFTCTFLCCILHKQLVVFFQSC